MKDACASIIKNFNRKDFYGLGAAQAELLDRIAKGWEEHYFAMDLWLDDLVEKAFENLVSLTGKPAPFFHLPDTSGKFHKLEDYRGKPLLLFFLSAGDWAVPAHRMFPLINKIYQAHKEKGLVVLGILLLSKPGEIETFLKRNTPAFPLLKGFGDNPYKPHEDIKLYRMSQVPGFVFIRPDGSVAFHHEGIMEEDSLLKELEKILK